MSILQKLLQDDSSSRFLSENWKCVPYSRPIAAKNLITFSHPEDLDKISSAANSKIKIIKDNQIIQSSQSFPSTLLHESLNQGRSLVIRHAEKSLKPLENLATQFATCFQGAVDIQIFLTPANQQTFDWHYDAEEVFIIQTEGTKKFTLRQNTINPNPSLDNMPNDLQYEKETSSIVLNCDLEAGDWLYIPKGWWHRAQAQTRSIHLSVGIDLRC